MKWAVRVLRYDQLTFWRVPAAVFFQVGMPLLLLTIFGTLNRNNGIELLTGVPYTRYLVVGLITFAIGGTAYGGLVARTTYRRSTGIYQRLRTTPLPVRALVAGQVASAMMGIAVIVTALVAVGIAFFRGTAPHHWPLFVLVLLVGTGSCCAVGMAVSTFVPSVEVADPIVFGTMLPIAFVSGAFQYVDPSSTMSRIADVFPLHHILLVTLRAFDLPGGVGSPLTHLAVVSAWGVAGATIAVRRFRWA